MQVVEPGAKHLLHLSIVGNHEAWGQTLADRPSHERRTARQTNEFNTEGK